MTPQQTKYYREAMKMIQAEEQLKSMEASMYPQTDKIERGKIHKKWKSLLRPSDTKVLKTTELRLI